MREQEWQSRDDKVDGGAVMGKLHSWNRSRCAVTEPEWPQCFGVLFPAGGEAEAAEHTGPHCLLRVLQGFFVTNCPSRELLPWAFLP